MSDIQNALPAEQLTVAYNPNLLVTYKAVAGTYSAPEEVKYITDKVTDIEWSLHHGRQYRTDYQRLQNLINGLEEQIVEWANPNYDKDDVLRELCEYFDVHPVKQIDFDATVSISGTVSVPFDELEDFDLQDILGDELSIDSNYGKIEISDWSIDHVRDNS